MYKKKSIPRELAESIRSRFFQGKALLVFGPRQVGKSTLCELLLNETGSSWSYLNGDDFDTRSELTATNAARLRSIVGKEKLVFIDEAQKIPNIGLTLKIFVDQLKDVQVIASGSSSFDLANLSNEPLTGREFEFFLFPISFCEMVKAHGLITEKRLLEQRMIYGYYPEIVSYPEDAKIRLELLSGSYLYQDLLMLDKIKKPVVFDKLLKALALQLGSEVNYNELSQLVEVDKNTVEKYIDLLEKAFVIFRVSAFSRNVRNELKKGKKIYFYDCGIRNAILGNFNPLHSRTDVGALWENFFLLERMKFQSYRGVRAQYYFWRTSAKQEIDFIEEVGTTLTAIECKWSEKTKVRFPSTFTLAYPTSHLKIVTPKTIEGMLGFPL
ncbi:ATP-binding protein [Algoriphagus namhaensis]